MNTRVLSIATLSIIALLALSPALSVNVNATSGITNPSVIPGSQAALNGPRVNNLNYLLYTSDHASVSALLAGQQQIMDFPPSSFTDIQALQADSQINVTTQTGSGEEFMQFNQCLGSCAAGDYNVTTQTAYNASSPGAYLVQATSANLAFRQAIAHLVDYSFVQTTALNGIQGVATQELLYPGAFPGFSNTTGLGSYTPYSFSLTEANASLAQDPYLAYSATAQPASSTVIACSSSNTGVWEYATSKGSGVPNGTAVEPLFYTRSDHPTWLTASTNIWQNAASIGLCLQMIQVNGFSQILPVVYTAFSTNWEMYFGGVGFSSPLNAMTDFFAAFTSNPGWVSPFDNPTHFYNATIQSYIYNGYHSSSTADAQGNISTADGLLMQQIPYLNIWWDSLIIPSQNHYGSGSYYSGYVNVPGFSTWTFATGVWTLLNVHQLNSTGGLMVGGTFNVGEHESPDDLNPFQATSVYDFDVINSLYDSPVVASPGNPTISGLIPWMTTSLPTTTPYSGTTPHGYKVLNGQKIVMNFMNNITFSDNVQMTAADYNFSLWYTCLNGCATSSWGLYKNNVANDFTGVMPDLTDSVVNSTYTMTIYVNGTGLSDYELATAEAVFPMHIWQNVPSTAFNADVPPDACQQSGAIGLTGTGPFTFNQWVKNQYINEFRNPGYFRTDIADWAVSAPFGSPYALSANLTQTGTALPSSASVTATVVNSSTGTPMSGDQVSLTQSSTATTWTGSLPTSGLNTGGSYEIVINGTYTDSAGQAHRLLQFWGLKNAGGASAPSNPVPTYATLPSLQCSAYSPSTSTTTTTTTGPSSTSTSTTTTSSPATTTTTQSGGNNLILIAAAVVVVVVVIAGIATYFVRKR